MSIEALRYTRDVFKHFKVSPTARHILHYLAFKHDHRRSLSVSLSRIASDCGTAKQNAHRAVEELKILGVLIVVYEPSRGKRTAQTYRFPADWDIEGSSQQWAAARSKSTPLSSQGDDCESSQGDDALIVTSISRTKKRKKDVFPVIGNSDD